MYWDFLSKHFDLMVSVGFPIGLGVQLHAASWWLDLTLCIGPLNVYVCLDVVGFELIPVEVKEEEK